MEPMNRQLSQAAMFFAEVLWPQDYRINNDDAPSTYPELVAQFKQRGQITVLRAHSENTIYGPPYFNWAVRAWHDWCHLQADADFSLSGERAAIDMQLGHLNELSALLPGQDVEAMKRLLEADLYGQALYVDRHGVFPEDQRAFVLAYLADRESALEKEWKL